jgi:AAA family ATP:ADP antiporter
VLYTVVGREDKFKSKNFIDTFVYRFGDQIGAWLYPALKALGVSFARLGPEVVVPVLVMFMAARRATNYAVSRPAREVLYTVVSREDKFKSKNFIDTFVYRFGDQIGVWLYPVLKMLGATAVSFTAVPLAVGWFVVAVVLGRKQRSLASP